MKEALTGQVHIGDCDTATFGAFLRFLYSGKPPPRLYIFETNEALFELGRRYGVTELYRLCNDKLVKTMAQDNDVHGWLREAKTMFDVIQQRVDSLPDAKAGDAIRKKFGSDLCERFFIEVGKMR